MATTAIRPPVSRQHLPHQKQQQKKPQELGTHWRMKPRPAAQPTTIVNDQKPLQQKQQQRDDSEDHQRRELQDVGNWFIKENYKIRVGGYQILSVMGEGTFGRVFRATKLGWRKDGENSNSKVALKVFKATKPKTGGELLDDGKDIEVEIATSMMLSRKAKLQSTNVAIVKTLGRNVARILVLMNEERKGGEANYKVVELQADCMAMELCEGGSLLDYMKQKKKKNNKKEGLMTEQEVAMFMDPIARALQFCHENGVLHLDVKPENVLLKEAGNLRSACLADFGVSLLPGDEGEAVSVVIRKPGIGTPWYMAPESELAGVYGPASDVWSLGAMVFEAVTGLVPPTLTHLLRPVPSLLHSHMLRFWSTIPAISPSWSSLSPDLQHLIRRMLCPHFQSRIPIHDLLSHPWLLRHLSTIPTTNS